MNKLEIPNNGVNSTEIPNVVYELLELGEISRNDFIVYSMYLYKSRYASDCCIKHSELAKQIGISEKALIKSKLNLSKPFSLLEGKSLICIIPRQLNDGITDVILIQNIWIENFEYFNAKSKS
jgi:hypothetical protein